MWNYVICAVFTVYCVIITYFKFNNGYCSSKRDMRGKTVVITGANRGTYKLFFTKLSNSFDKSDISIMLNHTLQL